MYRLLDSSSVPLGESLMSAEYFDDLPLDARILDGVHDMGFERMTPIQREAIPILLQGKDLIGAAQTGTGKTAAFLLPTFQRLIEKPRGITRAIILSPTRELALQIDEQMTGLAYHTGLTSAFVVGGMPFNSQERGIKGGSDVLICTPGRILDHMKYGYVNLTNIEVAILDEADRMLDMGFLPDVQRILKELPKNRQTLLFSATMAPEIKKLARDFLTSPEEVKIGRQQPADAIRQLIYEIPSHLKEKLLLKLLSDENFDSAIVFLRTKIGVRRLASKLDRAGFPCDSLHGDRPQNERMEALEAFRRREVKFLIATDVAARGLDISGVSHVINFDIPHNPEDYIHRVGRTARAEAKGEAVTFVTPEDHEWLGKIEKVLGNRIERAEPISLGGGGHRHHRSHRRRGR